MDEQQQQQQQQQQTAAATRTQAQYETQLPKEYQGDDFSGIESLASLYRGYRDLQGKAEGAVKIPTDKSTDEERAAFYRAIGAPETEDGYALMDIDKASTDEDAKQKRQSAFKKEALKNGLTVSQAKAMWRQRGAEMMASEEEAKRAREELSKSFGRRMDEYLRESTPDDSKRKARIEAGQNTWKAFAANTGLGSKLEEAGLTTDVEFMSRLAQWYSKLDPKAPPTSQGNAPERSTGLTSYYRH